MIVAELEAVKVSSGKNAAASFADVADVVTLVWLSLVRRVVSIE